jgi:two-component system nitrogen regulation sensor histidine kinase NtrY
VSHERQILLLALATGLPGSAAALYFLWTGDYSSKVRWTLAILLLLFWWGFAFAVRDRVVFPLQTIANLLAALREGDYSVRGRAEQKNSALNEVMEEVNALGRTLREQRLGAVEAATLLGKVMSEIDVAIFAFDPDQRLRLVNRAGQRLLHQPEDRLLGRTAEELELSSCLTGDPVRNLHLAFPGATGRWQMRRTSFHEHGVRHHLLVLSDLSRALREEEREAWQRLLRVLGHEINNSLAPVQSIAGSLEALLARDPRPPDWEEDLRRGLAVIGSRAEALSRFMTAYARLARLPKPELRAMEIEPLIRRVAGLETRLAVGVAPGPPASVAGDSDQLEQLLINLIRNAADAALETGGNVRVDWAKNGSQLEVRVEDEGPGLADTANLFVPFFTTKPGGSGIGLVLSRQIAEAHGGSLTLENRPGSRGCRACLRLPLIARGAA